VLLIDPLYLAWLYPELARFSSEEIRVKAWRQAWAEERDHRRPQLAIMGLLLITIGLSRLNMPGNPGRPPLVLLFAAPIMMLAALGWVFGSRRAEIRKALRAALFAGGVRVCINCAYDLTLNTSGVCPECGVPIPFGLLPFVDMPDDPDADLFDEGSDPADR
jgi:hypothetical protein